MAQGTLKFMHPKKGHATVTWDTETVEGQAAVKEARRVFNQHVGKSHLAAVIDPETKKPVQITEFDETLPNIVLYPRGQGGKS